MIALAVLAACGAPAPPPDVPPAPVSVSAPAPPTAEDAALAKAETIIADARTRLQQRMVQAMNQHAPSEAVVTCSVEAEALTEAVPPGSNAQIGRSSLRLRNPANAPPDWVKAWLDLRGEGAAAGAEGIRRVDVVDGRPLARVLAPIAIEPRCLTCHGPEDTLPADVRAALSRQYPDDQATGYATGDLRGAMWAEVPVTPAGG